MNHHLFIFGQGLGLLIVVALACLYGRFTKWITERMNDWKDDWAANYLFACIKKTIANTIIAIVWAPIWIMVIYGIGRMMQCGK